MRDIFNTSMLIIASLCSKADQKYTEQYIQFSRSWYHDMQCTIVALTTNNDNMILIVTNATDTLHSSRQFEVHDTSALMLTHSITGML